VPIPANYDERSEDGKYEIGGNCFEIAGHGPPRLAHHLLGTRRENVVEPKDPADNEVQECERGG
jgi:hypothetical protein